MASKEWGPFLSYWGSYCKDVLFVRGEQSVHFSERLLHTLCYETDVGSIPRGIELDTSGGKPMYFHSENWCKKIQGCYWCVDDNTVIDGVCCSKDCFYYLHDWCIERVHSFTKRMICRLPGCELDATSDLWYCSKAHEGKFDAAFPKGSDYDSLLKTVIRAGPTWYCLNETISNHSPQKSTDSTQQSCQTQSLPLHTDQTSKHPKKDKKKDGNQKSGKSTLITQKMDFPTELQDALIFKTDIGIIPRSPPKEHHLTSPYSSSPNWLRDTKGCYWCGNKSITANYNFCTYRCYLIFYEWCIRRIQTFTGVKMCRDTGCNRIAAEGFDCCNREHTKAIDEKYSGVKKVDLDRFCSISNSIGPNFYKKCDIPDIIPKVGTKGKGTQAQQPVTPIPVPQQVISPTHCSPKIPQNCYFSWNLTEFLFNCTDVGAIPRIMINFFPQKNMIPNLNRNAQLDSCYWCYRCPPRTHGIICSERCHFLLNEWVHAKYTGTTNVKLCRVLKCGNKSAYGFDCCNRNHSVQCEKFKKYSYLLKSTEFALGPVWYHDYRTIPVNFYNRDEPFYELTNFYPCQNLLIDGFMWPTTEHYFQASKFVGTPYLGYIRQLQAPRDAFGFSRNPDVQKWIRTNWQTVKIDVMLKALRYKFSQDTDLSQILIRTRDRPIFEHTKNDKFWGDGGDGKGLNTLGKMLMDVRAMLQISHQPNIMQPMEVDNFVQSSHNQNYGSTVDNYSATQKPFDNQSFSISNTLNPKDTPFLIDLTNDDYLESHITSSNNIHPDLVGLTATDSKDPIIIPLAPPRDDNSILPQTLKQGTQPNSHTGTQFIIDEAKHPLNDLFDFCDYPPSPSNPDAEAILNKNETSNNTNPFLSDYVDIPLPETTSGKMNPFSESQEHYPTNNSLITQAVNDSDVTMQDDDTSKNDITLNSSSSALKATQQLPVANTGDANTLEIISSSNSGPEELMDSSNGAQV